MGCFENILQDEILCSFLFHKKRTKRKSLLKQNASNRFGTSAIGWALGVFSRQEILKE